MAENLVKAVKDEFNVYPLSVEGVDEGRWVVVDYGALIVHLFYDFVRQEYRLEDLWKNGTELKLVDQSGSRAAPQ
jgi:nicotinate-nucleotide adenylyltransferase